MSKSCWQRNKKRAAIAFPILAVCIVIGVSIGVTQSKKKDGSTSNPKSKLEEISESLMQSMDRNVDPCEDFYKFTCGGWAKATKTPQDRFSELQYNVYQDVKRAFDEKLGKKNLSFSQAKLIDAYRSCLNIYDFDDIDMKDFQVMLDSVGGWPMGDIRWNEYNYDIDIGIALAIKTVGVPVMLQFAVLPDERNTSRNVINILAPSLAEKVIDNPDRIEYLKYIAEKFPRYSEEIFESDMDNLILLENKLREIISKSLDESSEVNDRTLKIKDLAKEITGVDFVQFFQVITNASLNDMNEFLTEDDDIVIENIVYFKELATLVESHEFPLRTYANYIGASILIEILETTAPAFDTQTAQQIEKYSKGPESWSSCLEILVQYMNYVTDRVYVDYLDIPNFYGKANAMIDNLRQTFGALADQANWLDKRTLSAVKVKLQSMRKFVGYAPWIKDDKKLEAYYKSLPDMGPQFIPNLKLISEFRMGRMLRKLRELNNVNQWPDHSELTTTAVNAFYITSDNSVYFPLGIQNAPFFYPDKETPWYMNFGAIGTIIGHEITHGFDSKGRQRDSNGNLRNWWSEESKNQFEQKSQCFIDQYSKFYDKQTGLNVDGELTLPENIADNGGLRQAFLGYQNWERKFGKEHPLPGLEMYTTHQLLFISYGNMWCEIYDNLRLDLQEDEHTPSPYRVWGTIANSKEFADTFKCASNTPMNPKDKCIIW